MNKLYENIKRIEESNNSKIIRVEFYGDIYRHYADFYLGFTLSNGDYEEVVMLEIDGKDLSNYYDEIINLYDKFSHKYCKEIKSNYNIICAVNPCCYVY